MIHKVEITGVHTVPDDQIKDYLKNSIAKLERYIPRHARESAHIDAKLIESRSQGDKKCTAEIILHVPHGVDLLGEFRQLFRNVVSVSFAQLN